MWAVTLTVFLGVITVTVTFNPDIEPLIAQLKSLPSECTKIVVDNCSKEHIKQLLRELPREISNTHFFENPTNEGLAAALNKGVKLGCSLNPHARKCLLLDQDSEPRPGCLKVLLEAFELLRSRGERVGCVGSNMVDVKTGLSHGFHQPTHWRWRRVYPLNSEPVRCANINGSGSLIPLELINQLGGLDESLFIDHVDTEWSFRVLANGYTLWGIPGAIFQHRMGDDSVRYWLFGWRVWPSRSPARHRYLFRNTLWLMRRNYVPLVWKFWAIVKLALTAVMHGIFDSRRAAQITAMLLGIKDGLAGRPL